MRKLFLFAATTAVALLSACASLGQYDKTDYRAFEKDGRLWVFEMPSVELNAWKAKGAEPGKRASAIGAGPNGMTILAPSNKVIKGYLSAKN
jgi:hypothetical protein